MNDEAVQQLRGTMFGSVFLPSDNGYDAARSVHNGLIDRRPALVARCRVVADVVAAVRFAADQDLSIAVRGGGHSVAGHGTCDDGMLVDLSQMRGVHVDPVEETVWVQGGATLGDVDRETQVYGLAVPTGQVSATGIAGLALNGGMGMLQRRYGLTCDNLVGARVVTASGDLVTASETENSELFWALRGGGGNFGVVTQFQFRAYPVGPILHVGLVAHPMDQAADVLRLLRDVIADAPEDLSADIIFQHAPPLDVIPEQYRGQPVVGIFVRWCGAPEDAEDAVRPLREFGEPVLDFVGPMPLVLTQSMLDSLNPYGGLNYWSGQFLPRLGDDEIDAVVRIGTELPSKQSIVQVIPFNGAVTRVAPDATAFAHRDESWLVHVLGQWQHPTETEHCVSWARRAGAMLRAAGGGNTYLNVVGDEADVDQVRAFWDEERLTRLAKVKAEYDPQNRFRFNHNIDPAVP
nr:FAD-binding oxidoreductase [Kibdelosporangium sp. MJ126-NF4]CEL17810.1 Probable oxidoreductase [Kibdelosporangium sp. MJ126-NF4]CTQ90966.1 Probable oxidoreductase [Kibdelosporangium sp. MJ126-NF4]